MEGGFPIASQGDFEAVKAISAEIRRPIIAALARANQLDIDRAWEALKEAERPRIHTFLATSDIHLQYKLHKTREEILKMISWAVAHAKSKCQDVEFSPEDAGRTDRNYSDRVLPRRGGSGRDGAESARHGWVLPRRRLRADVSRREDARAGQPSR